MKKRLTSFFLVLVLSFSFILSPASATYTDPDLPGYLLYSMKDFSGVYGVNSNYNYSFSVGNVPLTFNFPFRSLTSSSTSIQSGIQFRCSDNFKSGSVFGCTFTFPECTTDVTSDFSYSFDFRIEGLPQPNGRSYGAFLVHFNSADNSCVYYNGKDKAGGVFFGTFDPIFSDDPQVDITRNSSGVPNGIAFSGTLCTDLISGDVSKPSANLEQLIDLSVRFKFNSAPTLTNGNGYIKFASFNHIRFAVPSSDNPGGGGDNPGGGGDNPGGGGDNPGGDTSGLATLAEQKTQTSLLTAIISALSGLDTKLASFSSSFSDYAKTNHEDFASIRAAMTAIVNVLSNQQDAEIREAYSENVEQVKDDFLTGQSGKTSLGKSDFNNASQVGGALGDTFNMGGAAKISDFLSGFGSAGAESQAWFSQTTSNNLNAVEAGDGTQGASLFSNSEEVEVSDPDPYNMANIFVRYEWLEVVNMDD